MSATTIEQLDRFGRPCPVARATERLSSIGALSDARKLPSYELAHSIAREANDLIDRMETIGSTLEAAIDALSGLTDDDKARALLEVLEEYRVQTADRAFDLSAKVIAALERGQLIPGPSAPSAAQ